MDTTTLLIIIVLLILFGGRNPMAASLCGKIPRLPRLISQVQSCARFDLSFPQSGFRTRDIDCSIPCFVGSPSRTCAHLFRILSASSNLR
jgi:hypothetical protein